jgi:hypothetical protein
MKIQLYIVVSALAIFAVSCTKEKVTPNAQLASTPSGSNNFPYSTNVVVFDQSHQHSITYNVQSHDPEVLGSVVADLESSTLELTFASDAEGVSGITYAAGNAVYVTAIETNIGTATGYSIKK